MSRESIRLPFDRPKIFDTMKIEILRMGNGEAELSMPFLEQYTQHYEMLHGGVIFTLADAACGVAVASVAREGKKFLTSQMNINYLEPIKEGITLCCAKVLRQGRIMPVESEVWNSDVLTAKANAIYTLVD